MARERMWLRDLIEAYCKSDFRKASDILRSKLEQIEFHGAKLGDVRVTPCDSEVCIHVIYRPYPEYFRSAYIPFDKLEEIKDVIEKVVVGLGFNLGRISVTPEGSSLRITATIERPYACRLARSL
jgi:hypothetical protein